MNFVTVAVLFGKGEKGGVNNFNRHYFRRQEGK